MCWRCSQESWHLLARNTQKLFVTIAYNDTVPETADNCCANEQKRCSTFQDRQNAQLPAAKSARAHEQRQLKHPHRACVQQLFKTLTTAAA